MEQALIVSPAWENLFARIRERENIPPGADARLFYRMAKNFFGENSEKLCSPAGDYFAWEEDGTMPLYMGMRA